MRGADALVGALERAGVETVFGIPGGACLAIYDALYDSPIRHVLMRHEAAAGHAAEGFARASGRPGVAIGTTGPGATNLVTAIADAQMDSTPTLFITGQVKTTLRGTNAFQEADVIGITPPIVKHSFAIERADDIAQAVVDGLHIATLRPARAGADRPAGGHRAGARPRRGRATRTCRATARGTGRTAARCDGRPRRSPPRGGRCSTPAAASRSPTRLHELRELAALTGAPVTTTLMALGTFPASDPAWLGMLGMHGTRVANWAMDEADLIVAIGARFDDRVTGALDEFAPHAKVVHIDIDATEIGKNVPAHVPIVGDAKLALARAVPRVRASSIRRSLDEWWARIRGWQSETREPCDAEAALDALDAVLGDAIVTTDVGQHQMWAAGRLRFDAPRRWITSGGLGTMGFGLPAALGAQAAAPEATVVCVSGEGSFLMNVQELATAVEEALPVKVLLLDNASLGMVRQQQDLFWGGRRSAVDLGSSPDWELLARAFGWAVRSIGDGDEVADALAETLDEDGPALLHVRIAPEANCLPMFRPGGAAREMIG